MKSSLIWEKYLIQLHIHTLRYFSSKFVSTRSTHKFFESVEKGNHLFILNNVLNILEFDRDSDAKVNFSLPLNFLLPKPRGEKPHSSAPKEHNRTLVLFLSSKIYPCFGKGTKLKEYDSYESHKPQSMNWERRDNNTLNSIGTQ